MRRYNTGGLLCLVVFSAALAFYAAERAGAEEAKKIDLSAISKYVDDWTARDTFPDSPSFAYMNVYCRLALGGQVSDATKKRIIDYLTGCQKRDGGFVTNPEDKEETPAGSNLIFTYFALATLDLIGAPSAVDTKKAAEFVLSLVQEDGAIKPTTGSRSANLGTTCYGLRSLSLLKALDRIDKNRTIAYIESHRDDDKGFGVLPGKPSAPQAAFLAVDCLKLLGGLADDVKPGVVRFLKETPYSGLSEPQNPALMSIDNLAYVLETAATLSALQQFNTKKINKFIESRYIPENGGFGPSSGLGSTPPSTYYAIECLVKLGELKDPYSGRE